MQGSSIRFFDRTTGTYRTEQVYGDRWLRLAYGNPLGRLSTRLFLARPFLSRLFGWYARQPFTRHKIAPFIRDYGIDTSICSYDPATFRSFNDFFCRRLKPEARPVAEDPHTAAFPADGRHLGFPRLGSETRVFCKGQHWDLHALLAGDPDRIRRYTGGTLVFSRLCPVDYHHVHYPIGGTLRARQHLPGRLFSVNPAALRRNLAYVWQNRRVWTEIQSPLFGHVLSMEIGATNVGSIQLHPFTKGQTVAKGDHKGFFAFGGSAVVTLFEPDRVSLAPDLLRESQQGTELYALFGSPMAHLTESA